MANLVLVDSSFFITRAREGVDPFRELAAAATNWEFATCGMVMLEVLRGRGDPNILGKFQERFAVMIFLPAHQAVWERASALAWSLDRRGIVLPAQDLLIAACALGSDAAVLTCDRHFRAVPGLRAIAQLD